MKAEDFFNAYLVLNENHENLVSNLASSSKKETPKTTNFGAVPTMGVEIVCLAFSVELYIKDLHQALTGKAPRGHNILKLFEQLPEHIRKEIFSYEAISQNPFITRGNVFSVKKFSSDFSEYNGFIEKLEEISNGFEKWRYSYESAALQYDVSLALAYIDAIKFVANKIRKLNSKG